jgi:thiol-disulfide isomerase/thioredoxin
MTTSGVPSELKMKSFERFTNFALIAAIALFVLIHVVQFARSSESHAAHVLIGRTVQLPHVALSQQHATLLVGISTTCPYCDASMPFYRQLAEQSRGRVDVYAVMPESPAVATKFLAGMKFPVREVSADLGAVGIGSTPTLLMVDGTGTIRHAWVGMQDRAGEQNILSTLQE